MKLIRLIIMWHKFLGLKSCKKCGRVLIDDSWYGGICQIGITYPKVFGLWIIRWFWKRINCKRGMHLWDEVEDDLNHFLYCDACGKELFIDDSGKFKF